MSWAWIIHSLTWQHVNITQLQLTQVYYEYFSTCVCEHNVARGSHASPDPPVPIKAFPFCFVSFPLFDGIMMYLNIMWAKIELCIVYAHIILASKRLTALSLNMNTNNNRIITSAEFFHPQKRILTSNPRSASHVTASFDILTLLSKQVMQILKLIKQLLSWSNTKSLWLNYMEMCSSWRGELTLNLGAKLQSFIREKAFLKIVIITERWTKHLYCLWNVTWPLMHC